MVKRRSDVVSALMIGLLLGVVDVGAQQSAVSSAVEVKQGVEGEVEAAPERAAVSATTADQAVPPDAELQDDIERLQEVAPAVVEALPEVATRNSNESTATAEASMGARVATPSVLDFVGPPALDPIALPGSPDFVGPPQLTSFEILGETVAPGDRKLLRWSVSQTFAGGDTVVSVNVVHGVRPGPVLCMAAAIHGDEINGVEIVRRVLNGVDASVLSGTVVGVPIVNLFGFSRNSRYLPDRRDLNRYFPGSLRGSIASRIAYSFFSQIVQHCDAVVDFHTGSFDRANLPQVRADLRLPEVLRFARGFGALPVLHSSGSRGMLRVAATQSGIPAVTFEVGAPGTLEKREIDLSVDALEILLHHMGLVPEGPAEQEPQAVFYESRWVRANAGGMLIADVELGQRVVKGQRLGMVVDPIKNVEHEILSPLYGRVIGKAKNQVVLPGYAAFHIGEETSAEQASDAAAAGLLEEVGEEDTEAVEQRDAEYGY
ncbi:succinylglutamate desuccinylase/aspartoacylase family protein [Pseudomarimonas arenosa]|uniref:Succinylglutamate desuccinylase/aspartoacylase family protein n=1 Tax=Pseudomarimonas arenosa TaxID=2774145 RepID=A0AAW3ZPV7_9GAMM|nr:succinylglutamate desuccinylase/aspartoacylase family protein [Pseudomarimonas arenosa]MBD8527187.1 succinylglutamate desuccinylase/aspartoacylase family protein [Pseudomarimonas arenosa]